MDWVKTPPPLQKNSISNLFYYGFPNLFCFCWDILSLAENLNDRSVSLHIDFIEREGQLQVNLSVNIIFSQRDISVTKTLANK